MTAIDVEQRKANRLLLLYKIYCESTTKPVDTLKIGFSVGLKNSVFTDAIQYLIGETLVVENKITHLGIKQIEYCILNPDKASELYPPLKEAI